ncbi:MAG TPA: HAD family hydrolase [Thermoplasmata archaeon]|nr:HAD family hydrolase [Thermoplasmata archaeon]
MTPPPRATGPEPPLAVTIDLWYTLLAFSRAGPRAYERNRRLAWVEPLVAGGLPVRAAEEAVRAMEEWASRREATGRSVSLDAQADEIARLTRVRPDPDRVGHGIAFAIASADLRWHAGTHTMLRALRRRGLKLGIVSNILYEPPEAARGLLRRLGGPKFFDAIVLSSDGRDAKPAPAMIRRAARALGVPPNRLLHIGDSPADLLAAHRARVAFVRFTGRPRLPAASRRIRFPRVRYPVVRSWAELPDRFPEIWVAAAAARDRALRRARTGRGRPRPTAGSRGRARSSRRPRPPRARRRRTLRPDPPRA